MLIDGRFEQVDSPVNIYTKPKNRRVASLFGDPPINLFPVKPQRAEDGAVVAVVGGQRVTLSRSRADLAGRDCVLGVRPEDVGVSFEPVAAGIPVDLTAVTPFNVRTVTMLKTADNTEILASRPEDNALMSSRNRRKGWATFDLERALFFDPQTGASL